MPRFLAPVLLLAVALGAIVWALTSSGFEPADSSAAESIAQAEAPVVPDTKPEPIAKAPAPRAKPHVQPRPVRRPSHVENAIPRRAAPAVVEMPTPVELEVPHFNEMPSYGTRALKHSVRAYYANLPKKGPMPTHVTADEVLPRDLIRALGITPDTKIVEFGHYPASDRRGYEQLLEVSEKFGDTFGVTTVAPDGTQTRSYIKIEP